MRSLKLHKRKDLKVLLKEVKDLTTALCKKPYLKNTLLACGIQFGLTSSYYTLMVWFPELFTRFGSQNYSLLSYLSAVFFSKKKKTRKKKSENKKYYKYFSRYNSQYLKKVLYIKKSRLYFDKRSLNFLLKIKFRQYQFKY